MQILNIKKFRRLQFQCVIPVHFFRVFLFCHGVWVRQYGEFGWNARVLLFCPPYDSDGGMNAQKAKVVVLYIIFHEKTVTLLRKSSEVMSACIFRHNLQIQTNTTRNRI